jgi:hypothetical protein
MAQSQPKPYLWQSKFGHRTLTVTYVSRHWAIVGNHNLRRPTFARRRLSKPYPHAYARPYSTSHTLLISHTQQQTTHRARPPPPPRPTRPLAATRPPLLPLGGGASAASVGWASTFLSATARRRGLMPQPPLARSLPAPALVALQLSIHWLEIVD